MTYYIFMTPVLLMIVAMILRLRALKKHDKVLYAFCQLRRDTMSLIREHNYDLCRQDYIALRDIEDGLSDTIHDYNMHKVYLFNFRKFSGLALCAFWSFPSSAQTSKFHQIEGLKPQPCGVCDQVTPRTFRPHRPRD